MLIRLVDRVLYIIKLYVITLYVYKVIKIRS